MYICTYLLARVLKVPCIGVRPLNITYPTQLRTYTINHCQLLKCEAKSKNTCA